MLWSIALILPFAYAQLNMPEGCPPFDMPDCNWKAGEIRCPGTYDDSGCPTEGFCHSRYSNTDCFPTCPNIECKKGEILVEGGWDDVSGCKMQDYCAIPTPTPRCHKPEDGFTALTPEDCSAQELKWCNQGFTYYGCWNGAYCAVECVTME